MVEKEEERVERLALVARVKATNDDADESASRQKGVRK